MKYTHSELKEMAQSSTWQPEWRHQSEVRHVVRLRRESQERAYRYLEAVEARRGKQAAETLKQDAAKLFAKG